MSRRSNGEGSIYKRKDGRWCATYFDEKFKRHYLYGKTRSEVRDKLKEKLKNKSKDNNTNSSYSLQEWTWNYLDNYKRNELKVTTFGSYEGIFRKHIKGSELGRIKLEQLRTDDLQKYYNKKMEQGYSSKTVRSIEVVLNGALEMAYKQRLIPENPNAFTIVPKKEKFEAQVLSQVEVDTLVRDAKGDKLYPLIITAIYTGMRKGEIMGLKWEDVNFENKTIFVKHSLCRIQEEVDDEKGRRHAMYVLLEPKTKKSIRVIPMLDIVHDALIIQQKQQEELKIRNKEIYQDQGFVFSNEAGNHLAQRPFMKRYHEFLKRYKVKDVRFHDLRHTFASLLIDADVPIKVTQELLGHSNISTSMDIYGHVSLHKTRQAMSLIEQKREDQSDDEKDK